MTKKSSPKKKTKHGFAVLSNRDDLEQLWSVEKKSADSGDDFAQMFEQSLQETKQQDLFQEKLAATDQPTPLSKKERLKQYPPVQKILDLHGHTGPEAQAATDNFILLAKEKGLKTLRIIVGKGHHSEGKPVVPGVVEQRLYQLLRKGIVLDIEWEKKDKRKSGSVKVYLS
jgi:DNA-nicking Smr family endonuclease